MKKIVKGVLWSCVGIVIAICMYFGVNYLHDRNIEKALEEYKQSDDYKQMQEGIEKGEEILRQAEKFSGNSYN